MPVFSKLQPTLSGHIGDHILFEDERTFDEYKLPLLNNPPHIDFNSESFKTQAQLCDSLTNKDITSNSALQPPTNTSLPLRAHDLSSLGIPDTHSTEPYKKDDDELTADDVYDNNSGTILLLSINNRIIVASDTRHSSEYAINSRRMSRIYRIKDFFFCSGGFAADVYDVYLELLYSIGEYEAHQPITLPAAAHMLHHILYSRRFFPYRVDPCLAGFDKGKALIYSYDCVGSYEAVPCRCDGSAARMIQPLLDSWIYGHNFEGFQGLNFEDAVSLVRRAFDSAAEVDVKTKDWLEMLVVDTDRAERHVFELRKD